MRIVDLGCGTGDLTAQLHSTSQAVQTVGVDSSASMLAEAGAHGAPGLSFVQSELREFAAEAQQQGQFDLVLSNAALQWIPEQASVIERLTGLLTPSGQLAVQVPSNEHHASHVTAREVASESPFAEALGGYVRVFSNLSLEGYALLLDRLGFVRQHVRMQVYVHHLGARDDVIEWVRGSLLTDYQRRLPPRLFEAFLERYRSRLLPRLDDRHPYTYPFKRTLVWASRS
jgi:trans-aconitate 2-methyltransferase